MEMERAKSRILVTDDNEMNREILKDILSDSYEIVEAENGRQAVSIIERAGTTLDLVLLDIVMPELDGFEVLEYMKARGWIKKLPVIIISAEAAPSYINRAYELGVTDFITRPFDTFVVQHRVNNTMVLFQKQKKLIDLVSEQIYEKQKSSNLMVQILSHIVEFRNGESGLHVQHVNMITETLLKMVMMKTDRYDLNEDMISTITMASSLHDIGKISIPSEILNKPGRLTKDEYEIMKTHSAIGAEMLKSSALNPDEPLIKYGYEICRWHHERWDGRGYPDGLVGDQIPISAQVVSMADVYDALTSVRVYKPAYTHEQAMQMITNGECGSFNPLMMECLRECVGEIREKLEAVTDGTYAERQAAIVAENILKSKNITEDLDTVGNSGEEFSGYSGFAVEMRGYVDKKSNIMVATYIDSEGETKQNIIATEAQWIDLADELGDGELAMLNERCFATTAEEPIFSCIVRFDSGAGKRPFVITVLVDWELDGDKKTMKSVEFSAVDVSKKFQK